MSVVFRASNQNASTGSASSVTTGLFDTELDDFVIVTIGINGSTTVSSVTDLAGNSYSKLYGITVIGSRLEIWFAFANNANSSNSVTANLSANAKFVVGASSYSGVSAIGSISSVTLQFNWFGTNSTNGGLLIGCFVAQGSTAFDNNTLNFTGEGALARLTALVTSGGASSTNVAAAQVDTPGINIGYSNIQADQIVSIELVPVTVSSWLNDPQSISSPVASNIRFAVAPDFTSQVRPTLATLPNSASFLSPPGAPAVLLNYAKSELVRQERPTLATLPTITALDDFPLKGRRAPAIKYANPEPFVSPPKFGLTIASTIKLDGRYMSERPPVYRGRYALPDFVSQLRPTLALLPRLSLLSNPTFSSARGYARSVADVGPNTPPAPIVVGDWSPTVGQTAVNLNNALSSDFVNQIKIPNPLLPNFSSELTKLSDIASVLSYNLPESSSAPPEFNLPTAFVSGWGNTTGLVSSRRGYSRAVADVGVGLVMVPTTSGWIINVGNNSLPLDYATPDFVSPGARTALSIFGWNLPIFQASITLNYAESDYVSQSKPTLSSLPTLPFIETPKWLSPFYVQSNFVNQVIPTLVLTSLGFVPYDSIKSQPQTFSNALWTAPDKFNLIAAAIPTISSWFSTTGQNAVALNYAESDFVHQDRPTLATLPVFGWIPIPSLISSSRSYSRSVADVGSGVSTVALTPNWQTTDGQKSVVLNFADAEPFVSPPKFGLIVVVTPTISSWFGTDGKQAVQLKYSPGSWTAPDKFGQVVVSTTFLPGWFGTDGKQAVVLKYTPPSWNAPDKMTATVVISLYSWRGEDGYFPKFDWYSMSDTSTGPSSIASVQQAFVQETLGPNSLARVYASTSWNAPDRFTPTPPTISGWKSTDGQKSIILTYASSDWSAPAKFGIVAVVPATIANWTATIGQKAVVLNYALSDYVNQVKPTLATLPTLLFGIAETGPNAQPQKFAISDWSAPSKFGIIVPATPTIESWTSTIGQNAVVLNYAESDFVHQDRPTLATLPVLLYGISEPGPNAQPQKFVASLFDAPSKFNLPFISSSGWTGTDGQKAVVLDYASTDWVAPAKFGIIAPAPITISNWFGTDGQHAIVLKYASPDFVNQVRPTLATLATSIAFLDFIGPKAQPQKFASPDFVTQTAPTLATLPTGLATDFTVFGRRANPPTFSMGDLFTSPTEFGLSFIPGSILVKGVVFYKVAAANTEMNLKTVQTVIINGVVVRIVLVD